MNRSTWHGVMPAITNPYHPDLTIDHDRLAAHVVRMADAGSSAIVTPGSLGEGGALSMEEKSAVWTTCVEAVGDRIPIVAAVSAISTSQSVAIARAVYHTNLKVLVMDEPTAALGPRETARTLRLIEAVRDQGIAVIVISHSLDDVMAVSDRIQVMRRGRRVSLVNTAEVDAKAVLGLMIGAGDAGDANAPERAA